MMDKLMKLKEMKKEQSMRPNEKDAKMSVLKDIIGEANDEMGEGLKGFKKVSVMAPNKEGLKEGLEKAEELVGSEESEDQLAPSEEKSYDPAQCSPDEMEMAPEEIDQRIQALMALKEEKLSSQKE